MRHVVEAVAPSDTHTVMVETSDSRTDLEEGAPAAVVQCFDKINTMEVSTYLVVTGKANAAVGHALPYVAAWGEAALPDMPDYVTKLLATEPGTALAVPNGKAAVARLVVTGGDGALLVAIDPVGGISAAQLTKLTEALAGQIA